MKLNKKIRTMKVISKITSTFAVAAAMLFCSSAANAQETLTVDPVTVAPGEEAEVVVNYSSTVERSGYNMEVFLPEGLSFVKTANEDGDEEAFTLGSSALSSHVKSEYFADEKHAKLTIFHMKLKNLKDGVLLSFKVKADETLADNTEIKFDGVIFNGGDYLPAFTCPVPKGTATGINDMKVESKSGKSYNLGGQVVKGVKKGLIINNGKKIVQ